MAAKLAAALAGAAVAAAAAAAAPGRLGLLLAALAPAAGFLAPDLWLARVARARARPRAASCRRCSTCCA